VCVHISKRNTNNVIFSVFTRMGIRKNIIAYQVIIGSNVRIIQTEVMTKKCQKGCVLTRSYNLFVQQNMVYKP